jgi:predicted RNA-binding protein Jag
METAKEYLKIMVDELDLPLNEYHIEVISSRMKGFAKNHVKLALETASEVESFFGNVFDKNQKTLILKSYSLENVK